MEIAHFIGIYGENSEFELSAGYLEQLRVAVSLFRTRLGHEPRLSDFSDTAINDFTSWLSDQGKTSHTIRGRRNSLLTLWRAAYEHNLLDVAPRRIKRVRSGRMIVRAWSGMDVVKLLKQLDKEKRVLSHGIRKSVFFQSLISAGWDTSLRLGDLLTLTASKIGSGDRFPVIQHKTGDEIMCWLSDRSRKLIDECLAEKPRDLIWPLWGRRDAFYRMFSRIVARAGVTPGTFRYIRRGSITAVEAAGGNGSLQAGHRGRAVTERHYLDRSILATCQIRPPLLDEL